MAEFINTIEALGDEVVMDSIINRTITEFKDDSIETVGEYAFYKCTALETVDLPNAILIDGNAFTDDTALQNVNLPNVETLNEAVFYNCTSLKGHIHMPKLTFIQGYTFRNTGIVTAKFDLLETVGSASYKYSFYDCKSLKLIDLPAATNLSGGSSAVFSGCINLSAVILRNTSTVCVLGNTGAFANTPIAKGTGYVYVPRALVDSYKAASNWSTYAAQIRALEDYTIDGTITGDLDERKI